MRHCSKDQSASIHYRKRHSTSQYCSTRLILGKSIDSSAPIAKELSWRGQNLRRCICGRLG